MTKVIETTTGWMIRCPVCEWHEFPKAKKPNASWEFDGNYESPTFKPSLNECVNPPSSPDYRPDVFTRRCHLVVKEGQITFCDDCSHELKGQSMPLEPWPEATVKYHQSILNKES